MHDAHEQTPGLSSRLHRHTSTNIWKLNSPVGVCSAGTLGFLLCSICPFFMCHNLCRRMFPHSLSMTSTLSSVSCTLQRPAEEIPLFKAMQRFSSICTAIIDLTGWIITPSCIPAALHSEKLWSCIVGRTMSNGRTLNRQHPDGQRHLIQPHSDKSICRAVQQYSKAARWQMHPVYLGWPSHIVAHNREWSSTLSPFSQ